MATVSIKGPDGRVAELAIPDGATEEQVRAKVDEIKQGWSRIGSFAAPQLADASMDPQVAARRAADERVQREGIPESAATRVWNKGIPIIGGALDEIGAGIQAGKHIISGGAWGEPYDKALEFERAKDRAAEKQYSGAGGLALKIGAGLASAPAAPFIRGASLLGKMAGGAATGAGYGAAHGFAEGEGGFQERVGTAGEYAKTGALIGGVLPLAGAGAQYTAQTAADAMPALRARLPQWLTRQGPDDVALDIMSARLNRSGQRPAQIRQDLASGQQSARLGSNSVADVPETIADTSDAMQRLGGSIYRQGGEAGEIIRRSVETRQRGVDNPYSRFAGADRGQRGRVMDTLSRALGLRTKDSAYRTEAQIISRQKAEAAKNYNAAWQNQENFDLEPALNAFGLVRAQHRPGPFRSVLDRAYALFAEPMKMSVPGKPNFTAMDLRRFDASKRQLDDMIADSMKADNYGRMVPTNLTRELMEFKHSLLSQVHAPGQNGAPRNAAYQMARDSFGSVAENREAINLGRNALNEGSEVTIDEFRALSNGQKELFRMGLLEAVNRKMAPLKSGDNATALFQKGHTADLLREVIGNTKSRAGAFADRSGRFGDIVSREARMSQTRQTMTQGSQTAQRASDDAEFAADALSRVMTSGRGAVNMVLEFAGTAIQRATGYRQDVAAAIARRLMTTNRAEQNQILNELRRRMGRQQFRDFSTAVGRIGAGVSGAAGAEWNGG